MLRGPRKRAAGIAMRGGSYARVVDAPESEEAAVGKRHASGFVCEVDRALLEDAVDVVPPRIVIEQAIHRKIQLVMQKMQHPADAARGLAATVSEDAVVLPPELVFVEPAPDGVLFDVEDELGG